MQPIQQQQKLVAATSQPRWIATWHWRRNKGFSLLMTLALLLMSDVSQFRRLSSFLGATAVEPLQVLPTTNQDVVHVNELITSSIRTKAPPASAATRSLRTTNEDSYIEAEEATVLPLNETNPQVIVQGKPHSLEASDMASPIFPLPMPVFVVGLPKAGTTTIHAFFQAAKYRSGHWELVRAKIDPDNLIGICMRTALKESKSLLKECGDFEVWAQMDAAESAEDCVFPQISYLKQLHQEAPNATLILNRRNLEKWASSVVRWQGGKPQAKRKSLSERLVSCPDVGPAEQAESAMMEWHLNHIERIRQFVRDHPSHALLEIDIEDPKTADRMSKAFQLPSKYWGHANQNVASLIEAK